MSHPRGYDPHDAPPTQVFTPQEDGTTVLPPTQAIPPGSGESTTVLPAAQGYTGYDDGTAVLPAAQAYGGYDDGTAVLPNAAPPRRTTSRPVASLSAPGQAATTPAPHAPAARTAAPSPVAAPAPQHTAQPPAQRAAAPSPWGAAPAQGAPAGPGRAAPEPAGRGTEPTAVAALLTGIVGFVVPLLGVLAIILGGIGLDRTRRRRTGGRGMAKTGIAFGSIQVVFTAIVVIAGLWLWNAYGDDIQQALDEAEQLTQTDLSVPDLLLGGLTGDLSFGDLQDLAGTLGDADQLQELGGQCQAGDPTSCEDLLSRLPDGIRDQLPEDLRGQLPSGS
ncbi:DUF4190 domain-containing protein [Krasilnikoviella flava]|uniref:DUF4190 domain-containing protein n=1 Tax=Krasilnikoviella flava TaxID=526729 RepID=A0A1T5IE34_9MICO|nr:DUF4190 domain-containing protein [Krasilnikoviella flava]SKC37283.1 protein of unknown function [Krasilnikoviella flava]